MFIFQWTMKKYYTVNGIYALNQFEMVD